MTDDALAELTRLRARLAELEQVTGIGTRREHSMGYDGDDIAAQNERIQAELLGRSWRYSPELEAALSRLMKEADDPVASGQLRISVAFYREAKEAARKLGLDTSGGNR